MSFCLPVCSCPCQAASGLPGHQAQMELELLLRARNSYANIWLLGLYILPPLFLFLPLTSIPSLKLAISRTQTGAPGDFSLPRGTASGGRENSPPCLEAAAQDPNLRSHRPLAIYLTHLVLGAFTGFVLLPGQSPLLGWMFHTYFTRCSYPSPLY